MLIKEYFELKSWLLYAFIILTVLFDNTENTIYATISFGLLSLFSIKNLLKSDYTQLRYFFVFCLWCFCSLVWTSSFNSGLTRSITCLSLFVVLWVISSYGSIKKIEFIDAVMYVYLISCIILSITTYKSLSDTNLLQLITAENRLDTESINLNMLGKYFAIGGVVSLHFRFTKNNRLFYLPLLIFIVFVLLTKSRSSLLSLVIGSLFYLYFHFKSINRKKKFWVVLSLMIVILFALSKLSIWGNAFIRLTDMFDFFSSKRQYGDYSIEMRDLYLRKGLESILEAPILGHGIGSVVDVMRRLVDSSMAPKDAYFHNNYVQLLSEVGLIGFLLFYVPIAKIVKKLLLYISDPTSVLLLAVIIIFLFCDTNNTTYYHKIYYIFLGICFMFIKMKQIEPNNANHK